MGIYFPFNFFFQKLVDFYLIIGYNKFTLKQEM